MHTNSDNQVNLPDEFRTILLDLATTHQRFGLSISDDPARYAKAVWHSLNQLFIDEANDCDRDPIALLSPASQDTPDPDAPTDWTFRFTEALAVLCGGAKPPAKIVGEWLSHESDALQDWAVSHAALHWSMGITVIEAAMTLASEPDEGGEHEGDMPNPPACTDTFQSSVEPWMQECFGPEISNDIKERIDRNLNHQVAELKREPFRPAIPDGWHVADANHIAKAIGAENDGILISSPMGQGSAWENSNNPAERLLYLILSASAQPQATSSVPHWKELEVLADDYVSGYEFRGDEGDYQPTEKERFLIEDCVAGLMNEIYQTLKDRDTNRNTNQ